MKLSISYPDPAARIDVLLEQVAAEYRALQSREHLPLKFRQALAVFNLPGGYVVRGAQAKPLSQSITTGEPSNA